MVSWKRKIKRKRDRAARNGCPVLFYRMVLIIYRIFCPPSWIKCRVKGIEILAVQLILYMPQGLSKALEMHNFPCPQIPDWIADFRIFYDAENVVVSAPGFLFGSEILE